MPQQTPIVVRTPSFRIFLGLAAAWSALQCTLTFAIYGFRLYAPITYLLALLSLLPIFAMIAVAVRRRASESDGYLRRFYLGSVLFAMLFPAFTALLLSLVDNFQSRGRFDLGGAAAVAAMPALLFIFFAVFLLFPRRLLAESGLEPSPFRVKLMTPSLRRLLRMGVLALVYINVSFANHILFADYRLKGILAYAVALLPVLPIFGLVPIYKKYMVEEQDEFQRYLFQQSVLWAFLGTFVLASAVGRLQDHDLVFKRASDFFRPYSILPLFYFLQIEAGYVIGAIQGLRMKKDR